MQEELHGRTQRTPRPSIASPSGRRVDAALRQRQIVYGVATREQVAGKSGLEMFKAMIAGELPAPPISQTLDFILVEAEHGRVVFQGRPGLAHYNPMGIVHGGWFATLLDSALGCAVASILPAGKAYTTAELKVNIVRPLSDKVPFVRAESQHHPRRRPDGDVGRAPDRPRRQAVRSRLHHLLHLRRPMSRFLHTMLRVGDLQRSIDFYTRVMGMRLLRTTERPEQGYSLAFVGYGVEPGAGRDRAHLQPRRRARTSSAPPTATSRSA